MKGQYAECEAVQSNCRKNGAWFNRVRRKMEARAVNVRVTGWLLKIGPAEVKTNTLTQSVICNEHLKRKIIDKGSKKQIPESEPTLELMQVSAGSRAAVSTYHGNIMCISPWMSLKHHRQWDALKGESRCKILISYTLVNIPKWLLPRVCMAQMNAGLNSCLHVIFATILWIFSCAIWQIPVTLNSNDNQKMSEPSAALL